MITQEVLIEARKLWDYHHLNHIPEKADCILVLGSHDLRVADRGADLYLQGWSPILIFSGGLGNVTKGIWKDPEADKFARIALDKAERASTRQQTLFREGATPRPKGSPTFVECQCVAEMTHQTRGSETGQQPEVNSPEPLKN